MRDLIDAAFPRSRAVPVILLLAALLAGCASLPDNSNRVASYAYTDTGDSGLGKSLARLRLEHPGKDGFWPLVNGLDAFVARAVLAETAERSLDVQYYLYHDDLVGDLFTAILWQAAERGVRVRLLVDDMDLDGRDRGVIALDSHPNIEIRIFNPFDRDFSRLPQFVTGLGSVTRRMHNKSFTVDNVAAILGGRNIGDEYFDADPALKFADLDVVAIGEVVGEVSDAFDRYWNSAIVYPATTIINEELDKAEIQDREKRLLTFMEEIRDSEYVQALRNSGLAQRIRTEGPTYYWGEADLVIDDPEKITSPREANDLHLMTQLAPHFESIRRELLIVSPYFVPGREGVEFLTGLVDRGVRVRILTNSLASNDVAAVHAGYARYRKSLLRGGVEIFELDRALTREQRKEKKSPGGSSKASLHAKTFVLDREKVFVGSLNLDPRSFYENTEIGLVIEQHELASQMAENFDRDIEKIAFRVELKSDGELFWHGYEDGKAVTFDVEPHTSFWRRLGVGLLRLLPIESQL
ncbi:MAG: phospholipase D family protein [Gammaproteobacteria bacterium]|jgi:putative cardiolipin synthase